ncbi:hypothetical protein [[Eubacterium] cellulosolvens]
MPTITLYRERVDYPEVEPFVVMRANKIVMEVKTEGGFTGKIVNFFPLMGDLDYISSPEGRKDQYVLCWFDDREDDINTAFRKLTGVKFSSELSSFESLGKRIFDVSFEAQAGKY